jgi:glycosyltransferase involved in cell wall biosynthesis
MHVSVVIPAYNEEAHIAQCLDAVVHQTSQPDEIIVVDNNSTDQTAAIVRSFPQVRIIPERKQGMIYARNCGFDHAKGEIIARCDADGYPAYDWIERIREDFAREPFDALSGPIVYHDLTEQTVHFAKMYFRMTKSLQQGKETLAGPNMVITKAMWLQVRDLVCMDDTKVHEDLDLALHIHEVGGKIRRDDDLIVYTSSRRIRNNPKSFFGEYPMRFVNTLISHGHPIPIPHKLLKILKSA